MSKSKASQRPSQRFSIPIIRSEAEQKKIQQDHIKRETLLREKEKRRHLNQERRERSEINVTFVNVYGRSLLEAAISGETACYLLDVTSKTFELRTEFSKRGFYVEEEGDFDLETATEEVRKKYSDVVETSEQKLQNISTRERRRLEHLIYASIERIRTIIEADKSLTDKYPACSEIDQLISRKNFDFDYPDLESLIDLVIQLAETPRFIENPQFALIDEAILEMSEAVEPYESDETYLTEYYISWNYPEPSEHTAEAAKDCIKAKFLDWLSDKYGKALLYEIFKKIESEDLEGNDSIEIAFTRDYTSNEYSFDESRKMIRILDVDVPFSASYLKNMFQILGYRAGIQQHDERGGMKLEIAWER